MASAVSHTSLMAEHILEGRCGDSQHSALFSNQSDSWLTGCCLWHQIKWYKYYIWRTNQQTEPHYHWLLTGWPLVLSSIEVIGKTQCRGKRPSALTRQAVWNRY